MKYLLLIIIGVSLLSYCKTGSCNGITATEINSSVYTQEDTLKIMSSAALYTLTTAWVREYTRLNPAVKIAITGFNENNTPANNNLSFISNEATNVAGNVASNVAQWKMVIGHDAIIPVINAKNPMLNEIIKQGISAEGFAQLLSGPDKLTWAALINGGENKPVNLYIIDNEVVKTDIANFTKTDPSRLNGIKSVNEDELVPAVQKDLYSIGFCKLTDIRKGNSNELPENIKLLPVDKNGNGRIDSFENIYDNPDALSRGIWIGKYPRILCGSIYAVASVKPADKNALAFLTWILADGGEFLNPNGYSDLAGIERESSLNELSDTVSMVTQTTDHQVSSLWLIILSGLALTALIFTVVTYKMSGKPSEVAAGNINFTPALNENIIAAPKGLYFDRTHTWAFMEKNGIVRVGIDDFLQHITGKLTRIKMKEPGEKVRRGEPILTIIRDGKQLNINAPVSGIIKEKNTALVTDSSIINSSPYSEGWVYMIEPKNWLRETQFLFMSDKYKEWLKNEFTRLRDFFAVSVKSNTSLYAQIILQDGGQLTDNVLSDLGPEVWEDFQTNFINTSK